MDAGKAPPVFKRDLSSGGNSYVADVKSRRLAEIHQTPAKNVRGELPTVILTPDDGEYEAQQLAMTRSIGDFYMQARAPHPARRPRLAPRLTPGAARRRRPVASLGNRR